MIVCVQGLWHLGTVTAACLAEAGHRVIGLDHDPVTIAGLQAGTAPVAEPGLDALLANNVARLEFTTDATTVTVADVLWVTYDTPVDADDRADVDAVISRVASVIPFVRDDAVIIVSSQLPVGTVAHFEDLVRQLRPGSRIALASSPENLRLGNAIKVFMEPDRIVVGTRTEEARQRISDLLRPITSNIEWMTTESAEMTKHGINAFLALSVTFANELASVCERVGADAKEVERGLKTEVRIGRRAYLAPGAAFAGGTLARDVAFLTGLGARHHLDLPVLAAVRPSNEWHKRWALRRLSDRLGSLSGVRVAIWGLTYKPGTDTLRRSAAVELCVDLASQGAIVTAWDPAVQALPSELTDTVRLAASAEAAAQGASALVIATEWPEIKSVDLDAALAGMQRRLVLDANRFLAGKVSGPDTEYYAVGAPS